jgi:hypothetical protein
LPGASISLRIGDVFVFAVLNDSGSALGKLNETIQKITAPLTMLQARELLAKFYDRNLSFEQRPTYHSEINLWTGEYRITAEIPDDPRPELCGEITAFFVKEFWKVRLPIRRSCTT